MSASICVTLFDVPCSAVVLIQTFDLLIQPPLAPQTCSGLQYSISYKIMILKSEHQCSAATVKPKGFADPPVTSSLFFILCICYIKDWMWFDYHLTCARNTDELCMFLCPQPNRDLDMFINASKNFNLNVTWATSFTGKSQHCISGARAFSLLRSFTENHWPVM